MGWLGHTHTKSPSEWFEITLDEIHKGRVRERERERGYKIHGDDPTKQKEVDVFLMRTVTVERSGIPDQNGISQACFAVEIYHSGLELSDIL